jgi:hypothetical protein
VLSRDSVWFTDLVRMLDPGLDPAGQRSMSISSTAADRTEKRATKVDAPLADSCWIDRMRPVTPGEHLGWSVYLKLRSRHGGPPESCSGGPLMAMRRRRTFCSS